MDALTRKQRAAEKAAKYPAELKPNPDYVYELPRRTPEGWIEVDAGVLPFARDLAVAGAARKMPALPK